ncbi:MAG: hypothetical protein AAGC58_00025 [Asticcacaulis sp.]
MADEGSFSFNGYLFQGRALIARDDGRRLFGPAISLDDLSLKF